MNDNKEPQISNQTHDDHSYYESLATPGTSTKLSENEVDESENDSKDENELSAISLSSQLANAIIREPELKLGKESGHRQQQQHGRNDHGYKKVQQRILQLMQKEEKMIHKKDSNPLHWCQIGAEFSNCFKIILDSISEDIPRLFPPKNMDENQYAEAIERKHHVMKAYELLLTLNECFKRIYAKLNEFYKCRRKNIYYYKHISPSIQVK
ncbi:uncharacterized protein LOC130667367 [Microplitis mediator]|uniref:uncharacterized protein LOC130667367 n=1 Tax=Microplitis mediator TaxID=375433 RepID=UPI0025546864|nr:uncharacterized protein LOC130667367 [Microplitis mediator]